MGSPSLENECSFFIILGEEGVKMPKVSDAHREARREQIAAAALACFAEKGFQRTSMADIIEASGLSAGAIYLHFESKQQIVLTVGRRVLSRRLGDLEAVGGIRLADPVTTLQLLLSGMVDDIRDTRLPVQLWGEATTDPELGSLVTEIFAILREALTRYLTAWATRQAVPDPEAWATTAFPVVLSIAQGFMVQRALLPHFDAEAYFAAVRAIAGPGLLSPAP
jgi:AcrR family transcriptional regulator